MFKSHAQHLFLCLQQEERLREEQMFVVVDKGLRHAVWADVQIAPPYYGEMPM